MATTTGKAFKIPGSAQSGIITVGGKDLSCFLRYAEFSEAGGTSVDLGTWCDPGASSQTSGPVTFDAEWLNSFTDGQAATKAFYDELVPLADGAPQAVVFTPYGDPGPKWEFTAIINGAPEGRFKAEEANIVTTSWGISGKKYTPAVHS